MKIIKKLKIFLNKLHSDHLGIYSAHCAYFTLLSFIPFIILLLSLIKYMNIDRDNLIIILEAILPTMTKNSVINIIQEVYSKSIQTISVSAIFLLWSAANSFYALNLGLSAIYKTEDNNNYILLKLKGILGIIISIFSIIMVLILLVFGNRIHTIIQDISPEVYNIIEYVLKFRIVFVIFSLFISFILMYEFIPNKKGRGIKSQMPGAIFASIRMDYSFIFLFNIC